MKTKSLSEKLLRKLPVKPQRKVRRWEACLFFVVITVAGRLTAGSFTTDSQRKQYGKEVKPVWSPPGWLFGPAWTINNICQVWGATRLLNSRRNFPHRQELLQLQGIHWLIFVTFSYVYFRKRSPILTAIWTQGDALIALRSMLLAKEGDKKLALSYLPLTLWTWFASSISLFQALYNPDPLLNTDSPLKPKGVMKQLVE